VAVTLFHSFPVTIPAGTPKAAPLVTLTRFEQNTVDRIEWVFPDGCNGQVGIQIGARAIPIIPNDKTQFFIRSGSAQGVDVEGLHNTGDWSVIGYNTGVFPHTVDVTFRVHRNIQPEPIPAYLAADAIELLAGGG
jgi:hypothetical protein